MEPDTVWKQFVGKLSDGSFSEADCRSVDGFCQPAWIIQPEREAFRQRVISSSTPAWEYGEDKLIFTLNPGGEDEVRFDFTIEGDRWFLYGIDGVTIRVRSIETPFSTFPSPDQALVSFLRAESEISLKLSLYRRIAEEKGKAEAISWMKDGAALALNTAAWMPYFEHPKAFVVLVAWVESQLKGEDVVIEEFSNSRCVLLYRNHLWFKVYDTATHIRQWFTRDEYRSIFEDIWRDRAEHSGWAVAFSYPGHDTRVILTR